MGKAFIPAWERVSKKQNDKAINRGEVDIASDPRDGDEESLEELYDCWWYQNNLSLAKMLWLGDVWDLKKNTRFWILLARRRAVLYRLQGIFEEVAQLQADWNDLCEETRGIKPVSDKGAKEEDIPSPMVGMCKS